MKAVWSESRTFFITRTANVPVSVFIDAYKRGDRHQIPLDEAQLEYERNVKYKMSHDQRITRLLIILRDLMNLCSYDITYLPRLTHDILALSAFAYYELNLRFQDPNVSLPAIALLDELLVLTRLYLRHDTAIARFFVFNLATGDADYLARLNSQLGHGQFDWQQPLSGMFGMLLRALETTVDLEEFDAGTRYDFLPLLLTHSRLCQHFNDLQLKHRVAHLHPMLEHLETIRLHAQFAQSPAAAFLRYCPIHRLWFAGDNLAGFLKKESSSIHLLASIFELFAIFNLDAVTNAVVDSQVRRLATVLQGTRADALNAFCRLLSGLLSEHSPLLQIVGQNRFEAPFSAEKFIVPSNGFDMEFFETNSAFMSDIWQLKAMLSRLPETIDYGGHTLAVAGWIGSNVLAKLPGILFKDGIPSDPGALDTSLSASMPLLWPFYGMLGISFPRALFLFRFEHSRVFQNVTLLDMEAEIAGAAATTELDPLERANRKVIASVRASLVEFLESDECFDALWSPYSRRFLATKNSTNFSFASLQLFLTNFGLHALVALDTAVLHTASACVTRIMTTYNSPLLTRDLSGWLRGWRADGAKWPEALTRPEIQTVGKEMIRLGVAMAIRKTLREASVGMLDRTVPGLVPLITTASRRNPDVGGKREAFIIELCTTVPTSRAIEVALPETPKSTDPFNMFLLFAFSLGAPWLGGADYIREMGCMKLNLHLFPLALVTFVDIFKHVSVACDQQIVSDGMGFFFSMAYRIIDKERSIPGRCRITESLIDTIARSSCPFSTPIPRS
jgi:hypothetical protein